VGEKRLTIFTPPYVDNIFYYYNDDFRIRIVGTRDFLLTVYT